MEKNNKIVQLLNRLYNIKPNITYLDVYSFLEQINVNPNTNNSNVNNYFFIKWMESFKNISSMKASISEYNYFCTFQNGNINNNKIRVFVPLDFFNIDSGVTTILYFMHQNNINGYVSIAKDIKSDGVMVTLNNRNDAINLNNYLIFSLNYSSKLMKPNPFYFENNGLVYSYNSSLLNYDLCISHVIAAYIYEVRQRRITEINIDTFKYYVDYFLNNDSFLLTLPGMVANNSEYIAEAKSIVGLFKLSLDTNNIEDYFNFVEHGYNYLYNNVNGYTSEEENKKELLKELILTTMKKYPIGYDETNKNLSGLDNIFSFMNGYIDTITEENNLRQRVNNQLTGQDIMDIISNSNIPLYNSDVNSQIYYYICAIMLDEIIKCTSQKFPGQEKQYINAFMQTGDLKLITGEVGNARALAKTLQPHLINSLFAYLSIKSIDEYMNNYYGNLFKNSINSNWRSNA